MAATDLDPRAIQDLARSGLTSTDLLVENVPNPYGQSAGYLIPYFDAEGKRHPKMFRQKLYEKRPDGGKYHQPSSEELSPDPTPPYFAPPSACDYGKVSARKLIVEGEKKAVAAIKYLGLPAIGIGGCANWHGIRSQEDEDARKPKVLNTQIKAWVKRPDTEMVEVCLDGDMMTNPNVAVAGNGLYWALRAEGIDAQFVVFPNGMGLDDWVMSLPPGTAPSEFEALPRIPGWRLPVTAAPEMFRAVGIKTVGKTGRPEYDERTIMHIINRHPAYMGRLWVDVVKKRPMDGEEPIHDGQSMKWLTDFQEFMPGLRLNIMHQAMTRVSSANRRNPVKEWLDTLVWDGKPRLERLAPDYFKADDNAFTRRAMVNFMVAAVARMVRAGTKFDNMLVLQGKQGIGKTRALIGLFGKDYACIAPHTTAIGSRDWLDAGGAGWCLILDELAGLTKVEHTELKTALSTESDTYRRAYRKDPEVFPRQFVCAATTNESVFLTDPTGNRRYWSIPCNDDIKVEKIIADREQLWAEAVEMNRQQHPFWSLSAEAEEELKKYHEQFFAVDDFTELVGEIVARAQADEQAHRPPVVTHFGAPHYFIGTSELAFAAAAVPSRYATGVSRRLANIVRKEHPEWVPVNVRDSNGVKRRGYVRRCDEVDALPRTTFDRDWESAFGRGSKF